MLISVGTASQRAVGVLPQVGRLVQGCGAAASQDDGVPGGMQGERGGASDATARAGDQRDLAVGAHRGSVLQEAYAPSGYQMRSPQ